jgi:serine/threonine protein kinase
MDSAEQAIYIGATLGNRYLVEAHLGDGNFSGVFAATDQQTGRKVAVKILSLRSTHSAEALLEFDGEKALLKLLAGCTHVVELLDDGTHQLELVAPPSENAVTIDVPYLVLELADASLSELLLERDRLPWQARLKLLRDLVKGVHQMHLGKVVNGLVFSAPQGAKIADLGRSKHTRDGPRFIAEALI